MLFGLFGVEPSAGSSAGSLQVHRLRTARVGLDFEAHLLAFDQRGHPRALDGGDMDENVLGAVLGRDETEALGGVKEFHGSRDHVRVFLRTSTYSSPGHFCTYRVQDWPCRKKPKARQTAGRGKRWY